MRYGCGKALELGLVCSCGMEAAFKAPLAELPECVLSARLGRSSTNSVASTNFVAGIVSRPAVRGMVEPASYLRVGKWCEMVSGRQRAYARAPRRSRAPVQAACKRSAQAAPPGRADAGQERRAPLHAPGTDR